MRIANTRMIFLFRSGTYVFNPPFSSDDTDTDTDTGNDVAVHILSVLSSLSQSRDNIIVQ